MQTVNGGGYTIDDQEQLEEKIDRLENEIDRLKTERQQPDQETPDRSPDTPTDSQAGVSRRGFLKAVAGGAAGLGLTGMLPSAAALDIKSPHDLSYYGGGSTTPDFEVDTQGNLNLDGSNITNAGTINTEKLSVAGIPITQSNEVTYYVDQANGDDSNNGTSKSEAFASYERALEEAPRFADEQVTIRQIGDYSTDSVRITNKKGTLYKDGSFSLRIVGDSELHAVDGNDQSNMETFDGDFYVEGVTGFEIDFLNINGMPWVVNSSGVTLNGCYLEGGPENSNFSFAYSRCSTLHLSGCVFDGQANDPSYGVYVMVNGNVHVRASTEIKNWDQQNKTFLFTFGGATITDGVQSKYPNTGRKGIIIPAGGRGISDEAFDRDLGDKPLTFSGTRDLTSTDGATAGEKRRHDGTGLLPSGIECRWDGSNWQILEPVSFSYSGDDTTGRTLAAAFRFEQVVVTESGGNGTDAYAGGVPNGMLTSYNFAGELTVESTGGVTIGDGGSGEDPNTDNETYEVYAE